MLFHNGIKFVRRIDAESPMSDLIVFEESQNETSCLNPESKGIDDTIEIQNVLLEHVVTYTKENLKDITQEHLSQILKTIGLICFHASKDDTALDKLIFTIDHGIVAQFLNGAQLNYNPN